MNEHKLRLESISGNSEFAQSGHDHAACAILLAMGFCKDKIPGFSNSLYIGADPVPGKEFFVYYTGPLGDTKEKSHFRLVRVDGGVEYELDRGTMSLGHYNKGVTPTYYARGALLPSYSFHFRFDGGHLQEKSPICAACGHEAKRSGACYECPNCGERVKSN